MNWPLLRTFVKQELKDRYVGSVLGGLWSFVTPLIQIAMFALIFSKLMGSRLESFGAEFSQHGYAIYLIIGIIAWTSFATTTLRVASVFREKSGLLGKVHLSLMSLPLYILVSEGVIFFASIGFYIGYLMLIDYPLNGFWFYLPVIYFVQQLLAYSVGYLLGVIGIFVADVKEFLSVALQLWFWLTPIVYVVNILESKFQFFFTWNPMTHIIGAFRDIVISSESPIALGLLMVLLLGLVILVTGLWLSMKLEKDIRDLL